MLTENVDMHQCYLYLLPVCDVIKFFDRGKICRKKVLSQKYEKIQFKVNIKIMNIDNT